MKTLCLTLFTIMMMTHLTSSDLSAQNKSPAELIRVTYDSEATGEEHDYFLYLPAGYHTEPGREWPVLMFLHGHGERGNAKDELDFVLAHGPLYEAWIQKKDLPFIILSPQLPMYGMEETADYLRNRSRDQIPQRLEDGVPPRPADFLTPNPMRGVIENDDIGIPPEGPRLGWHMLEEDLISMIDHTLEHYASDPARVYLTGLSYGGFGTWYIASRHPERFAAIVPIVGYGHPDLMDSIAEHQIPVWCIAGGRDPVVQPEYFYTGMNRLEELGLRELKFTIHADMAHDAWTRVYRGTDVYDWMLRFQKEY